MTVTCRAWISSEQKASMRKNAKIKQTTKAYDNSKLENLINYACAFLQSLHTLPQDHPQKSTRTLSSPCYVDPDRDMLCYLAQSYFNLLKEILCHIAQKLPYLLPLSSDDKLR